MSLIIMGLIIVSTFGTTNYQEGNLDSCSSSFITAKVITNGNNVYHGLLELGNNDIMWTNQFCGTLVSNKYSKYVPEEILKTRNNYNKKSVKWIVGIPIRENVLKDFQPDFNCDYSVLNKIERKDDKVYLELQNQEIVQLVDKRGDLDYDISIDLESNEYPIKIKWKDIKEIEFKHNPNFSVQEPGIPLYGQVKTEFTIFKGIINWDYQEKHTNHLLNGRTKEGRFSIPFKEVTNISRIGDQAIIKLSSGDIIHASSDWVELFSDFGNDIGRENAGIEVKQDSIGKISFNWTDFREVYFEELPENEFASLIKVTYPQKLRGEITTKDGISHTGILVYNLYKERDIEYLFGYDLAGAFYAISFQNIQSIFPKNEQYTVVKLRNNQNLLLWNTPDVNNLNDGLLVFDNGEPIYIPWKNIEQIKLYKY